MKLTQGDSRITNIILRSSNKEGTKRISLNNGATAILTPATYTISSQDKSLITQIRVYGDSKDKTLREIFGE